MIVNQTNLTTLYTGFSAAFREGFGDEAGHDHMPITMETASTGRTTEYGWLGKVKSLEEWVGERVLQGIVQHGYSIANKKFNSGVEVDRDDIEDDEIGVYRPLFMELGRAASAHPTQLVFGLLKEGFSTACYDGQYFFDTDHPVRQPDGTVVSVSNTGGGAGTPWFLLDASRMIKPIIFQRRRDYQLRRMDDLSDEAVFSRDVFRYAVDGRCNVGFGLWQVAYGSKQTLNAASYAAARQALHEMKNDAGRPMGIRPTHLVVPPGLETAALELINAERNAAGATNVWRGTATVLQTPWLA